MKTTRKELFDRAWELPMTKLAKEFGCSDVGLRKTCVKNKIPLPPAGHWQKILYGKGYEKPELPFPDLNPEITISAQSVKTAKHAHEESAELEKLVKTNSNPRIVPAKNLNERSSFGCGYHQDGAGLPKAHYLCKKTSRVWLRSTRFRELASI